MAYDETLAQRVRHAVADLPGLTEKRMFGGIGFMLHGNMACGVIGDDLIVRVGRQGYEQALAKPGARPFDMTGRPMRGWVAVGPAGHDSDEPLQAWVQQGVDFALTLLPK
jgi:TfoX/Sxy family transcriptional regulator of competence genes